MNMEFFCGNKVWSLKMNLIEKIDQCHEGNSFVHLPST
jgi:hypothetical protein